MKNPKTNLQKKNNNWNEAMKNQMSIIFFLIMFLCNSFCVNAQSNLAGKPNEKKITKITIASEPDYPPYCFIDKNGNAEGFSIDLFNAAAKAVGIEVNIKIGVWRKIKKDLAEGKIDALPLVGRTPERESFYDFTLSYISLHGAVFVREGTSDINSLEGLFDKEILVMKGDNAEEFVRREHISKNIFTTHTYQEAFEMLANGEHDAVITQRITGLKLLEEMGIESIEPLKFGMPKFRQDFCFAVKKGDAYLLSTLNEGLSIVIADGTHEKIREKWFGPSVKEEIAFEDVIRIALYILIPLIIIFSIIFIFSLRAEVKKRTLNLQQEIADHKETLNLLNEQQLFLEEMEKVSKTGGWEYLVEADKFKWTNGVYSIYGVSPSGFEPSNVDKNISSYHSEDQKTIREAFQILLEHGKPYQLELKFNSADGKIKWIRTSGEAEVRDGKIVRLFGNMMDVTEQKTAREELREAKVYLESLITYANAPIIVWNNEYKIERFNRSFEKLTGRKVQDVIGQSIDILSPVKKRDKFLRLIKNTALGERWESVEIEIQNIDGTCKTVLWNSANIYDTKHKNIIATIAHGWDITERDQAIKELNKLNKELEARVELRTSELEEKIKKLDKSQKAMLYMVEDLNHVTKELKVERQKLEISNKELEAFSYSVSHDLRAPLRAIQGFSRFLMEDYEDALDDEGKRLLNVIQKNTIKMDKLISDLLNLSRLSRTEMNLVDIDMKKMVNAVFDETASDKEKKNFSFIVSDVPNAFVDAALIKQVWSNLINNGLKYSSKSKIKKIEIGYLEDELESIYFIKDYGAGFDPKYKHKLFGVFQRLHKVEEFEGTGVGLAIVQRIIHRHNGRVWADGELNKGASFYFSLPKNNSVNFTKPADVI
jgi:PAS domain S-box-containing protein